MVNAVVLAGGKDKTTVSDVAGWVFFNLFYFARYRKLKIPGSYKSFMKVGGEIEGIHKKRPSIEYILYALDKLPDIERVSIVTNPQKLEEKLDVSIKNYMSKCTVVEQVGSIMQNADAGYRALGKKGHTLFITGDAPQTTKESIESFWNKCIPYINEYDFIYPVVSKKAHHKFDNTLKRIYFDVEDDITGNKDEFMKKGLRSFRITSMVLANPDKVNNKEAIDYLYDIRNIATIPNLIKAKRLFKEEINKVIRSKIFGGEKLTLSDLERKMSSLLDTRFKFVELEDAHPSLDLDDIGDVEKIEIINGYHDSLKYQKSGKN